MRKTAKIIEVDSVPEMMRKYQYAKKGDIFVVVGREQVRYDMKRFYNELRMLELFFTLNHDKCDTRPALLFMKYEKYKKGR
jgi:hypothetical protein